MGRNRGHVYREQLARSADGTALSDYLSRKYGHSSEPEWAERIRRGRVRLDGAAVEPGTRLAAGQWLSWERPGWTEPTAPLGFGVLYDDAGLVAVAKPSGLPTLPGGGFLEHTLLYELRRYREDLRPLHRLGRHTSGIVLCATHGPARASLSRAWNRGTVEKRYRALASGRAQRSEFEIDVPIGPVPYPALGTLHAASARGKPAHTRVRVIEQRDGEFLCDVSIATGRPHQIRIHLAAAGHPLAGDPLYAAGGLPPADCCALPGDGGYALHATALSFPHPLSGRPVTVRCRPPAALRKR